MIKLPERIIAFDPGRTTGIIKAIRVGRKQFYIDSWDEVKLDLFPEYLHQLMLSDFNTVVVEDFRLYAHKSDAQINNDFPSVQAIGMIKMVCHLHCRKEIVFQMASAAKGVGLEPDVLKAIRSPHVRDAYRHIKYYILLSKNDVQE